MTLQEPDFVIPLVTNVQTSVLTIIDTSTKVDTIVKFDTIAKKQAKEKDTTR